MSYRGYGSGGGGASDVAWDGSNWDKTDESVSQNQIQTSLKDVGLRYEDRVSQLTLQEDGCLLQAYSRASMSNDFEELLNTNNSGWKNNNIRMLIPANELSATGDAIRVTFSASNVETFGIALAYVGHAETAGNVKFDGNQVKLTFSSSNTVDIAANTSVVSDTVSFSSFDNTKDLIISYDVANDAAKDGIRALLSTSGAKYMYFSTPDAGSTTRAAVPTISHNLGVKKVEVGTTTPTTDIRLRSANAEQLSDIGSEASAQELDLDGKPHQTLTATGNVTLTLTNSVVDVSKKITVLITASGGARTLTFPTSWFWDSKPASDQFTITSGATARLTIRSYGTATIVAEINELET